MTVYDSPIINSNTEGGKVVQADLITRSRVTEERGSCHIEMMYILFCMSIYQCANIYVLTIFVNITSCMHIGSWSIRKVLHMKVSTMHIYYVVNME